MIADFVSAEFKLFSESNLRFLKLMILSKRLISLLFNSENLFVALVNPYKILFISSLE